MLDPSRPSRASLGPPAAIDVRDAGTLIDRMRAVAHDADHGVVMVKAGEERRLSYADLFSLAGRIAAGLSARGVAPGDRIIIVLPQGFELIAGFLACMAVGAIPSILPPISPKQDSRLYWRDMTTLFDRIQARLLVTSDEYAAGCGAIVPEMADRVALASDMAASSSQFQWRDAAASDVAFLQHSSGTTAVKKGVMITHAAAISQLATYARTLDLVAGDRVASWLPLYHDMGLVACFLLPVMMGLDLVMLDTFEWVVAPALLLEAVETHGATLAWLPNFAFQHIGDATDPARRFDLSSLRAVINCSETCRAETMDGFIARFADSRLDPNAVQTCYAMAETVFAVSQSTPGGLPRVLHLERSDFPLGERLVQCPPEAAARRVPSCGPPIEGVEVRILGASGQTLDSGVVGQIAVRAPFLFEGYYRLADATAEAFADGWYLTGDLGLLVDGELYVTGRLKDMLIIHGKNIMAHDVEAAIATAAGVKPGRAIALGVLDARAGSDNLIAVVEADGSVAEVATLKRDVKRAVVQTLGLTLSRVHVAPAGWIVKSTSGKLNRKENLNKFLDPELGAVLV